MGADGGKMSVSAISNSSPLNALQTNYQQLRQEFTQLGQDLSSGNLTQAQTDFVTLSQAASSQFGSNSPIAKTLNAIGQALQSGSLSSAQQAFGSLPIGIIGPNAVTHHSHVHWRGALAQSLQHLGQALQSGNLSAAQQAFSALQQSWQAMSSSGGVSTDTASGGTADSLSITA